MAWKQCCRWLIALVQAEMAERAALAAGSPSKTIDPVARLGMVIVEVIHRACCR